MTERDMAKYAALFAAGVVTEDALSELIGDDSIVSKIVTMAGAVVIMTAASDLIEDTVDVVADAVDDFNPFSGW